MNNESPENQPPVTNDNDAPTLASAVTTTEVAPSPPEQVLLPCLCCDFCDNVLCTRADILSDQAATFSDQVYTYQLDILEEMFPVYSATNPATVRFDVARVSSSTVDRRHIVCEPRYSPQHSWFPPYEWSMASCGSCGAHLGWGFAARDDAKANEQLESHKKSLVAALTELAENDHRKSKSQSKSRGESEVPATSTGAKRSRSRSVESSGANNNESRQVTDNAENDDADDDDRFETAESHSVDGEEAEDEEDWADCDEEVEEEDEEETDPEAEKIGLLADVDPTLHKYWSKLPEVLRQAPKTKGHSPLAFVGLIVTRCRAKESASAEYVNENIAGAVNREYENLRFHSIVRQIFQLLNSVPQNLRGMANSIGMLVLQIRQSYHSRGGIEAVLAEAQGLSDISTQLARLAQSDGGQALVDHLIRVDAPASPEARAQQIRDFSAHAREGRQQVPQPESVPEDEAEPEGSAPTETNNAETEPRSHTEKHPITMKKHPGSFPQAASIPVLYNVVKRCKEAMPSMQSNSCYAYPQYGPNGASLSSYQPNPSNPSNSHRESTMLLFNEKAFVVNDPFNKSTFHCLVLPWDTKLKSLNDLNDSHLPLLDEMAAVGKNYMSFLREQHMGTSSSKKLRMILGFHAIPSLPMLHMHCISLDLESEKLKKKQHYNSFATYYFLPFEAVRADLVKNKTVTINQNVDALNELADGPMKCLWCGQALANMPDMKRHVPACPKNMSRE